MIERIEVGPLSSNSYLIFDEGSLDGVVIDAGDDAWKILRKIRERKIKVKAIYITHGHFDHVLAIRELKEALGCEFYIHEADEVLLDMVSEDAKRFLALSRPNPPRPDGYVYDGERIEVGQYLLKVLHTPGHTPGSVSYIFDGGAFTGDLIFAGSIGRTDMPGGDLGKLLNSIFEKIFKLPDDYAIYPGHGPSSTIGVEKAYNLYVGEDGLLRRCL